MFRNATAATLAATGLTVIFDVPLAWTSFTLVTTFVTTYHLPNIAKGLNDLKDRAESFYHTNKPRAKALANDAAKKAADVAWACSPTNPEQNVTLGASLGFAASNVAATLFELNARNYPLAVGAATIAAGTAGHFLPRSKVNKGLEKVNTFLSPAPVGKANPKVTAKASNDATAKPAVPASASPTEPPKVKGQTRTKEKEPQKPAEAEAQVTVGKVAPRPK